MLLLSYLLVLHDAFFMGAIFLSGFALHIFLEARNVFKSNQRLASLACSSTTVRDYARGNMDKTSYWELGFGILERISRQVVEYFLSVTRLNLHWTK